METKKTDKKCKGIRVWLYEAVNSRIGIKAGWVQWHIANCPRCQRRLTSAGKVNLALSIIKSQPHKLDLLMRANTQAIGVLKHSLRNATKARKLKTMLPNPKLLERCGKYKSSLANAAACMAILLLMKAGIFSSMDKLQSESQRVVRQYYVSQAGQDLADEIFST